MADKKERPKQYPITLKESVYRQVSDYCETWHLKRTQFVEMAIHTFLHMDGDPRDICKNISYNPPLPSKAMEELTATLKKSNRLQKKILARLEIEEEERENTEKVVPSPATGEGTPKSVITEESSKPEVKVNETPAPSSEDNPAEEVTEIVDDDEFIKNFHYDDDYAKALWYFNNGKELSDKLQVAMVRHGKCPMCGEAFSDKGKYLGHTVHVVKCPYYAKGTLQDPRILEQFLPSVTPIKLTD